MEQRITRQMLDDALCAAREIGRREGAEAERAAIAAEVERRRAARFEAFEARGDCCDYNAEVALLEVCEWLSARSKGEVA